jgi:hypothetical protein
VICSKAFVPSPHLSGLALARRRARSTSCPPTTFTVAGPAQVDGCGWAVAAPSNLPKLFDRTAGPLRHRRNDLDAISAMGSR